MVYIVPSAGSASRLSAVKPGKPNVFTLRLRATSPSVDVTYRFAIPRPLNLSYSFSLLYSLPQLVGNPCCMYGKA